MPYVHLKVAGSLTQNQKKEIAKQFSQTLLDVAKKPKKATYLVIEEVDRNNWAIGDKFLSESNS